MIEVLYSLLLEWQARGFVQKGTNGLPTEGS